MNFSFASIYLSFNYIVFVFTVYYVAICEGNFIKEFTLRKTKARGVLRELDDYDIKYLSFVSSYDEFYFHLCSRENLAVIYRTDAEFCKFVYTYTGTYDKTNQIYRYSNYRIDEEKSRFYVASTSCNLAKNEYTYARLKNCADAKKYIDGKTPTMPDKIDLNERSLYFKGMDNTWDFTSLSNDDVNYRIINSHFKVYKAALDRLYGYSKQSTQYHSLFGLHTNITSAEVYAKDYGGLIMYLPDEFGIAESIESYDFTEYGYCYNEECDYVSIKESWGSFYAGGNGFRPMPKEDVRKILDADKKSIRKEIRKKYRSKLTNKRIMESDRRSLADDIGYYYEDIHYNTEYNFQAIHSFIKESNTLTILTYGESGAKMEGLMKTVYSTSSSLPATVYTSNYNTKSTFEIVGKCETPTSLSDIPSKCPDAKKEMNDYLNTLPTTVQLLRNKKIKLSYPSESAEEYDLDEMSGERLRLITKESSIKTIPLPSDKCFNSAIVDDSDMKAEMNITTISGKGYISQKMDTRNSDVYMNFELGITPENGYSQSDVLLNNGFYAFTTENLKNSNAFVYDIRPELVKGFVDLIDCENNHNNQINNALKNYNENAYFIDIFFSKILPGGSVIPDDDDEEEGNKPTIEPTLPTLKCPYKKGSYRFIASNQEYDIEPSSENHPDIKYYVECNGKKIDNVDGVFKYTAKVNDTTKCKIECSKSGYNNGTSNMIIKTIEYKPSISEIVYPGMVNKSSEFNASITLSYPKIENLNETEDESLFTKQDFEFQLKLEENKGFILYPEDEKIKGKEIFQFNNYYINSSNNDEGTFDLTLKFEGNSTDDRISATRKIKVMSLKECNEAFGFDADGACCKRESPGELCTNIKTTYKFDDSDNGKDFKDFKNLFVSSIQPIFNGTHFFDYDDTTNKDLEENKVVISVRYISDRNNTKTRLLQSVITSPLDIMKKVMRSIGPAEEQNEDNNDENINGDDDIFDQSESQFALSLGIKTTELTKKLKEANKEIKDKCDNFGFQPSEDFITTETEYSDSKEIINNEKEPWEKEYWWVILIICIVVVLLIVISVVCIYSHSKKTKEKRELEAKQMKIKEKEIPVEKIVDINSVDEEDLYIPYFHDVIIEGYLLKQGRKNFGKWQKRYCVLFSKLKSFRIYESMTPSYGGNVYLNEKQDIPMDCYSGIEYKEGSNEFTLILKIRESSFKTYEAGNTERKIHFKCEGSNKVEEAKKWVDCFRDFKNKKPKTIEAWTNPVIINKENQAIVVATDKAEAKKNQNSIESALRRKNRKTPVENKRKPVRSFIPASLMVKVGIYSKPK